MISSSESALLTRFGLGLFLSAILGIAAYRKRSLSGSGVAAAILVGTSIFTFGGWVWGGTLIAFFASSSLLSHYGARRKTALAEKFAKGSRRDLAQTIANGGLAALIAVWAGVAGRDAAFYPVLASAFCGALAAVNADTWATELGVLARRRPRLITTGQPVPVGTSGGVTAQGMMAAVVGAAFIGLAAFTLIQGAAWVTTGGWLPQDWYLILIASVSGVIGSLFDSLLGATVQCVYFCETCGKETEQAVHRCGRVTRHMRGWSWLDNDWVNFLASVAGAATAAVMGVVLF